MIDRTMAAAATGRFGSDGDVVLNGSDSIQVEQNFLRKLFQMPRADFAAQPDLATGCGDIEVPKRGVV